MPIGNSRLLGLFFGLDQFLARLFLFRNQFHEQDYPSRLAFIFVPGPDLPAHPFLLALAVDQHILIEAGYLSCQSPHTGFQPLAGNLALGLQVRAYDRLVLQALDFPPPFAGGNIMQLFIEHGQGHGGNFLSCSWFCNRAFSACFWRVISRMVP